MKLSEEQQNVLDAVVEANPGDIITLIGYAGTGKTVTASACVKAIIECRENPKVLICAPTASALSVLKNKIEDFVDEEYKDYIDYKTLSSLTQTPTTQLQFSWMSDPLTLNIAGLRTMFRMLKMLKVEFGEKTVRGIICTEENQKGRGFETISEQLLSSIDLNETSIRDIVVDTDDINYQLKKNGKVNKTVTTSVEQIDKMPGEVTVTLERYDLIVIDEYSMVSRESSNLYKKAIELLKESNSVLDLCEKSYVTLLCGDAGQLQPVQGMINREIKQAANGKDVFVLNKILRSTNDIAYLAKDIRESKPLNKLDKKYVKIISLDRQYRNYIDYIYEEIADDIKQADVVLTFTNKNVDELNAQIRLEKGMFGDTQPGDKIICTRNAGYRPMLPPIFTNGEILKVQSVEPAINYLDYLFMPLAKDVMSDEEIEQLKKWLIVEPLELVTTISQNNDVVKRGIVLNSPRETKTADTQALIAILNKLFENQASKYCYYTYQYAYSMTVHKSQGSEWDSVLYIVSKNELSMQRSYHAQYTAVTRARKYVKIVYVD